MSCSRVVWSMPWPKMVTKKSKKWSNKCCEMKVFLKTNMSTFGPQKCPLWGQKWALWGHFGSPPRSQNLSKMKRKAFWKAMLIFADVSVIWKAMLIFAFVSVTGSGVPWGTEESQEIFRHNLDGLRRRTPNWAAFSSGHRMSKHSRVGGRVGVRMYMCVSRAGGDT